MIPANFEYVCPKDLKEAVQIHRELQHEAVYLAGGTDLVPRLKLGLEKPKAVIDLKSIGTLKEMDDRGEWIRVGALVSLFDLAQQEFVREYFPALKASLAATSCETLQLRGAVGGNLLQNTRCLFYNQSEFWRTSKGFCWKMGGDRCNAVPGAKVCFASYCSDNATALASLAAEIELYGPEGERRIPLDELYSNKPGKPFNLRPGEILTAVLIPKRNTMGGYEKLRLRGAVDYPLLGLAFSWADRAGKLAVGAMGPKPFVADMKDSSPETLGESVQALVKQVRPVANTVLDPNYRKRMIPTLAGRLVREVMEGVRG